MMGRISTDVLALGAILGSAAVGGAVTLALANNDGPHLAEAADAVTYECTVSRVETAPRVVVSLGSDTKSIVVAPDVSVRTTEGCEGAMLVEIDDSRRHDRRVEVAVIAGRMERAELEHSQEAVRERMDRVRERLDRTRERVERARERVEGQRERAEREVVRAEGRARLRADRIRFRVREGAQRTRVIDLTELAEVESVAALESLRDLDFGGAFTIDLDDLEDLDVGAFNFDFNFDFDGLDRLIAEGLEDSDGVVTLDRIQEMGDSEELSDEDRERIKEGIRKLKERIDEMRRRRGGGG